MDHTHKLVLTPAQAEKVQWALDAMVDYVLDPECDYAESDLPLLSGREFRFSDNGATEDLLYRIGDQLPDMTHEQGAEFWMTPATAGTIIAACERLVELIQTTLASKGSNS